MKVCKYCGTSEQETKIIGDVCRKHYIQIRKHGTIINRSIYDKNEIIIEGEIAKVHLYNKNGDCIAIGIMDSEDVSLVSHLRMGYKAGYVRCIISNSERVFLHRIVMNCPNDKFVDHINGNTLDNRKCNLRICSHKENIRNMAKKNRGVAKNKTGSYIARICYNYKSIHIGTYNTFDEAQEARYKAELQYFGEFASKEAKNWSVTQKAKNE